MAGPIRIEEFQGHRGYSVVSEDGVLGADDAVSQKVSHKETRTDVPFDDINFVDARNEFERLNQQIADAGKLFSETKQKKLDVDEDKFDAKFAYFKTLCGIHDYSPRLRSNACMAASGAKGLIADRRSLLRKSEPGGMSALAMKEAMRLDPTNTVPQLSYGVTELFVTSGGLFEGQARDWFSETFGVLVDDEIPRSITKLSTFPNDVGAQVVLKALLERAIAKGFSGVNVNDRNISRDEKARRQDEANKKIEEMKKQLELVEARVDVMRAKNSVAVAETEALFPK